MLGLVCPPGSPVRGADTDCEPCWSWCALLVFQYREWILIVSPAGAGGMLGCCFFELLCEEQHTSSL